MSLDYTSIFPHFSYIVANAALDKLQLAKPGDDFVLSGALQPVLAARMWGKLALTLDNVWYTMGGRNNIG